ncbi:MAG: tetratricopeptide repeat protein [Cyanophyceae cyanobacterium]
MMPNSQDLSWLVDEDWDDADGPSAEETYQALRRSVERTTGFGLKFVQCTPAAGAKLRERLRQDFAGKRVVQTLDLVQPEHKLFDLIESQIKAGGQPDVLCVVGLEYSLVDDIEPGDGGGQGDYYNPGTTPRILAHLNQNREKFRDSFPFVTIFFLPKFAQKYFTRRASDFVDWGSGIFELRTEIKTVLGQNMRILNGMTDPDRYSALTSDERRERRINLQTWIEETKEYDNQLLVGLLMDLGSLFLADENCEDALRSLQKALDITPDDYIIRFAVSALLHELGEYKGAVDGYDKVLKIDPNQYDAWRLSGLALEELGKAEKALDRYDQALKVNPDWHEILGLCGMALCKLGRYEEAISKFALFVEAEPNSYRFLGVYGSALFELGRYEEAISIYDKFIKLSPDTYEQLGVWCRAASLMNIGRYKEAIIDYDRLLKTPHNDPEFRLPTERAWKQRGIALENLGLSEDAIASYERAIEIKLDDHEAWTNRGMALVDLDRFEDAIASYDKALEIKPDYHDAWYDKACCYGLQGKADLAIENLARAIDLSPNEYRKLAKTDTDFDPIRSDPRFQALLNPDISE